MKSLAPLAVARPGWAARFLFGKSGIDYRRSLLSGTRAPCGMSLIGGLDSISGVVIGATLVTCLPVLVPNILNNAIGQNATNDSPQIAQINYGALIVVFIIASPGAPSVAAYLPGAAHGIVSRATWS